MARCTTRIFESHKIPNGSTVTLWTAGKKEDYGTVVLVEGDLPTRTIRHSDLHRAANDPNPPSHFEAVSPTRYVVTFFTNFRSAQETEVGLHLEIDTGAPNVRKVLNCSDRLADLWPLLPEVPLPRADAEGWLRSRGRHPLRSRGHV